MSPFPNPDTQFKPGQSGNPAGKPKGSLNWSTIVKNLLEDPDLADKVIKSKPGWWDNLEQKNRNFAHAIGVAMLSKAAGGDEKAAKWVRETGFGNKLDLTTGGEPIKSLVEFVGDDDGTADSTD